MDFEIAIKKIDRLTLENSRLKRKILHLVDRIQKLEGELLIYEPYGTINTDSTFPIEGFPASEIELLHDIHEFINAEDNETTK